MSDDPTGSGSGNLGGATGAAAAGGAAAAVRAPNGGAGRLGRLVSGLPLPVHDHETPSTGGELDAYLRTAWGTDHVDPAGDPHGQYATDAALAAALAGYLTPAAADALFLTPAEGDARYAAAGSGGAVDSVNGATGAVVLDAADVGALTQAQADARYEPLDSAYTKAEADARYLTASGADALFLTPAEGAAAYAAVDHTHPQVTTGEYHFQTNPAMTDPGSGNFRSNTGAAATATALAMDQLGAGGTDITTLFNAMRTADTIFVQDKNDAAQWVRYQLTAPPTISSGWAQVPVSVVASGGTIAGSQLCVMQLTLTAGGGGGGTPAAPGDASYVTLAAEAGLAGETALGAGVVMRGTLAARPAAATAGRLYQASDTGVVYRDSGSAWQTWADTTTWVSFVIDGGGSAITAGQKGHFGVPAGTIVEARLLADVSGALVVDLWRDSFANYPPVVGDSICASAKPTLSAAAKAQDTTLTGWSTACSDGDLIAVNVDSAATVTRATLALKIRRS